MQTSDSLTALRPDGMSADEWTARLELAACYRLFDFMGWTEAIFNHITLRVPGGDPANPHYLINPFGLHYTEVTATNLVKIDAHGLKIGDSPYPINAAGFTIHSVIHAARPDAHCVIHTHTTAGMAVACKRHGLRHDNFYSAILYGRVAYHDFEGVTTDLSEGPRLVASLADKDVLILRSHGLLVTGEHVPGAFETMWLLQRACEVQMACDAAPGENWPVADSVLRAIPQQRAPLQVSARKGEAQFQAMLRRAGIRLADCV
jgi:ribulose-5-phosphate 4-epimerase/fuculose-1-phosphate aldolase